jgi:FkbM family methyltransferase
MKQRQGYVTGLLKRVFLRQFIKGAGFQTLWSRLHTIAIYGMNYGGGGFIHSSGEEWVLSEIVAKACGDIPNPVIFDVGANIGDYSFLVRQHIPKATIYAFEPSVSCYGKLTENLKERSDPGIQPINIGFSDVEKTVELYSYAVDGRECSMLSSIDKRLPTQVLQVDVSSSERIQTSTIDIFRKSQGIERIDFLKLDVEGHEIAILKGAERAIASGAISLIQFEFGPQNIYSRTYFYDFWSLLSSSYDLFRIIPKGIVPIEYYGEHREVFLNTNYLAVLRKPKKR